jgi:hypothetical protein
MERIAMVEDDEDTDWLNLDLSGVRPEIKGNAGHNQMSELDQIAQEMKRGLNLVAEGEEAATQGWLIYGVARNKGRAKFPVGDNKRFNEWLANTNLVFVHPNDAAAASWAASNPEQFEQMREKYPNVRTVRGWHDKWKKDQKPTVGVVPTDSNLRLPDQKEAERIKNLKDRQASTDSEAEKEAVQRKLDKYKEQGVDVDAVVDQKQEDQNRDEYFREKATRDEIAIRIATKLVEQANIRVIKTLVLHAFPNTEELEQAELDYTTQYEGA